ncbi:hypothetical protein BpHYR1_041170 [Brachionus plicatilis]|uniref:Uncharacterized protein n=1 Tax=Brachionus plicatilis TaxID=10195 RepID=A0A3M7PYU3_BRAPC|nr:hypothetical protein BpHYR1_041170 [Brachionus plicatilis]
MKAKRLPELMDNTLWEYLKLITKITKKEDIQLNTIFAQTGKWQQMYWDFMPHLLIFLTHPIISDIEHSRYLIDLLHLFLRISDVLFELIISELATLDNFSTSSTYSIMKHPILTKLICYLNENCEKHQLNYEQLTSY